MKYSQLSYVFLCLSKTRKYPFYKKHGSKWTTLSLASFIPYLNPILLKITAQQMKVSIKDFFRKCD